MIFFIAPTFSNVIMILLSTSAMQVFSYVFVMKKLIDFEKDKGLLEQMAYWHIALAIFDFVFFFIFQ